MRIQTWKHIISNSFQTFVTNFAPLVLLVLIGRFAPNPLWFNYVFSWQVDPIIHRSLDVISTIQFFTLWWLASFLSLSFSLGLSRRSLFKNKPFLRFATYMGYYFLQWSTVALTIYVISKINHSLIDSSPIIRGFILISSAALLLIPNTLIYILALAGRCNVIESGRLTLTKVNKLKRMLRSPGLAAGLCVIILSVYIFSESIFTPIPTRLEEIHVMYFPISALYILLVAYLPALEVTAYRELCKSNQ